MSGTKAGPGAAILVLGLVVAAPSVAGVTPLSAEFHIDHANPEASVPSTAARNAKPLEFGYFLQDLATFGEMARKSGDHLAEARYYRALTKAVPDSAAGFAKLCTALDDAKKRQEAVAACRQALGLTGATVKEYVQFVRLTLAKRGDLAPGELEDVKQAVAHLRESPETRLAGSHLQCEIGVRTESVALLEECTAALAAVAPNDPKTIAFQWALAVRKGDHDAAGRLIARAKSAGLTQEAIGRMERATTLRTQAWRHWLVDWRVFLAVAVGIAAGFSVVYLRHRRELARVRFRLRDGATS